MWGSRCSQVYFLFDSYRKHCNAKHNSSSLPFVNENVRDVCEETFPFDSPWSSSANGTELYAESESSSDVSDSIFKNDLLYEESVSVTITEIEEILTKYLAPFQNWQTEVQRLRHFQQHQTFILPQNHKLGEVKFGVEK